MSKLTYFTLEGRKEVQNKDVIKRWYEVDKYLKELNKDDFDKVLDAMMAIVWDSGKEYKRGYNKLYPIAKRYGWRVNDFANWYCIED